MHGEPLFSSHMLDLSEEPLEENIAICKGYMERMAKMGMTLEMELGITGGEEDGVDNTGVDSSKLYTQPEEVWQVYEALSQVPNAKFTIAAAFGNVHGVYKPGNVKLSPHKLGEHQAYVQAQLACVEAKPIYLVMHGGSGSTEQEIADAVSFGTVKMNIDTDTQWAYWDGLRAFEAKNRDYLQGQIGNPKGADKPNKSFYDPRKFIRAAEESLAARVLVAFDRLGTTQRLGPAYGSVVASSPKPKAWAFVEQATAGGAKGAAKSSETAKPMGPTLTTANLALVAVGALLGFAVAKNM